MSDYETTFKLLDADGDGLISPDELVRLMDILGQPITIERAEAAVKQLDLDGDGLINVQELGNFLDW
ncbi:EF-hand domain-containing protein [Nonomuraea soli]|uniref:Ca2+-binding EF-hand superfamily protein n=1 Tax=Nonomuraea soli TaxID=1032476 RepID=A0A7W0CQI0_9ACTN|nr:EF-hand domain-containing protein [Nonomuraea soli]MBA2895334.1 Ca2+-binding EF-hand superfamily protein [Nonomuraea soli]